MNCGQRLRLYAVKFIQMKNEQDINFMASKPMLPASLRVQRKRTKGFKMPDNTVYVGRGSRWGNPFKLFGDMIMVDAGHRRKILSKWVCYGNQNPKYDGGGFVAEDVVKLFRDLLMDLNSHEVEPEVREKFKWMRDRIRDLEGKRLACWCKEENCCHADALIELANCR